MQCSSIVSILAIVGVLKLILRIEPLEMSCPPWSRWQQVHEEQGLPTVYKSALWWIFIAKTIPAKNDFTVMGHAPDLIAANRVSSR